MRLATFNVHMWRDRAELHTAAKTIELLRRLRCDAVALQEVPGQTNTLARVAAALKMHYCFAPASTIGNALLSVKPPQSFDVVSLASGNMEARSAFIATLAWEGGSVMVLGTHLEPHHEKVRMRQHAVLLGLLGARPQVGCTFLAGDLNALHLSDYNEAALAGIRVHRARSQMEPPTGEVTAKLQEHGFVDLGRYARTTQAAPPNGFPGPPICIGPLATCWAGTRIDYIWAGPNWANHARLVRCEHAVTSVSDHLPVVAEIAPLSAVTRS
jgi:endonuclease/exonuclease/phosphatase family metal-dependent hydrolase